MPLVYDDETSLPDDLAKDALGNAASHPRGQLGGQVRASVGSTAQVLSAPNSEQNRCGAQSHDVRLRPTAVILPVRHLALSHKSIAHGQQIQAKTQAPEKSTARRQGGTCPTSRARCSRSAILSWRRRSSSYVRRRQSRKHPREQAHHNV